MKNDPAFPCVPQHGSADGLTKRELFAAMAMQGLLARGNHGVLAEQGITFKDYAYWSTEYADALLAELEKKK
jgi:hypothetical protein